MKAIYVPLDERPCNYSFAGRIAEGSGVEVIKPEMSILGNKKQAADHERLREFILNNVWKADCLILSLDMLLYGGILPSRLHHLSEEELCRRLSLLDEIKALNPKIKIYAFALIMRCPKYSSSDEEPDYYEYCGREIFLTGQVKHKSELGLIKKEDAESLILEYEKTINGNLPDFENRRRINRNMLLKVIEQLNRTIDFLIIPQDDSAEYGYTTMDREAIKQQIEKRGLSDVAMYPGADEVGMTLLARAACDYKGVTPKIYCHFAHEDAPSVKPLYEDRPVGKTLPHQIESAGCTIHQSYDSADIILYLNYPSKLPVEAWEEKTEGYTDRDLEDFTERIIASIGEGRVTALADGAYCNGGDRELLAILNGKTDILKLSAYAGWNTSSNTLGTVICQAVFVFLFGDNESQRRFLAERIYEDVGYCAYVRSYVTANLLPSLGFNYFDAGETSGEVAELVRENLERFIEESFPNIKAKYCISRCRMPWKRMFEVDLSLKNI